MTVLFVGAVLDSQADAVAAAANTSDTASARMRVPRLLSVPYQVNLPPNQPQICAVNRINTVTTL